LIIFNSIQFSDLVQKSLILILLAFSILLYYSAFFKVFFVLYIYKID